MDSIDIVPYITVVIAFIGFIWNLISYRNCEDIIRCKEVCEDNLLEILNDRISHIANHYKCEMERILTLITQNPKNLSISSLELRNYNGSMDRDVLDQIKSYLNHIQKIESILQRLNSFRWIFLVIIVLTSIEIGIQIFISSISLLIPSIFLFCTSTLFLIALLFDSVKSVTIYQRIRQEYDFSIRT